MQQEQCRRIRTADLPVEDRPAAGVARGALATRRTPGRAEPAAPGQVGDVAAGHDEQVVGALAGQHRGRARADRGPHEGQLALDEGGAHEYEIVVPEEVDGAQFKISLSSPLGKSLIGKGVDDDVEVQTPKGKRSYGIKKLITIHTLLAQENGASKG